MWEFICWKGVREGGIYLGERGRKQGGTRGGRKERLIARKERLTARNERGGLGRQRVREEAVQLVR